MENNVSGLNYGLDWNDGILNMKHAHNAILWASLMLALSASCLLTQDNLVDSIDSLCTSALRNFPWDFYRTHYSSRECQIFIEVEPDPLKSNVWGRLVEICSHKQRIEEYFL